ncbi:MAG: hypothetical protein NC303_04735 [Firmicutes bacterium]|nr:hypothetical protein [Bacillota bacterium]
MAGCGTKQKILYRSIALLICICCAVLLYACNKKDDNKAISESNRSLYLHDIIYDEDELTMCAVVAFKGEDGDRLNAKLNWKSETYPLNILFKQEDVAMRINPSEIYREIEGGLASEETVHDGTQYNRLKIALRYDTIYKSISSDGNVTQSGRYYLHYFDFDETENEQTFSLRLKTQITANWYTLLIALVLVLAVVLLAVTLAIKGKLWQRKKK